MLVVSVAELKLKFEKYIKEATENGTKMLNKDSILEEFDDAVESLDTWEIN